MSQEMQHWTWQGSDDELLVSSPSSGPPQTPVWVHTHTLKEAQPSGQEPRIKESSCNKPCRHLPSFCLLSLFSKTVLVCVGVCLVCVAGMRRNFPEAAGCVVLFGFFFCSGSSLLCCRLLFYCCSCSSGSYCSTADCTSAQNTQTKRQKLQKSRVKTDVRQGNKRETDWKHHVLSV